MVEVGAVASESVGCFSSCEITIPVPPVLPGPPPTGGVLKRSGVGASVGVAVGTGAVWVTSVGGFKLAFSGAAVWCVGPPRYLCVCVCVSNAGS